MDRDRGLYHFSEEGDITYCSGEGQALALRGLARLQWRGTGFSLPGPTGPREITVARDRPSPYGASRDYGGEGGASLSLALRENGS